VVIVQSPALARLVALEWVPSLHGSGADAPTGQNEPGVQGWQVMAPLAFMNVPASQSVHFAFFDSGCRVPGAQGVCSVLPVVA